MSLQKKNIVHSAGLNSGFWTFSPKKVTDPWAGYSILWIR